MGPNDLHCDPCSLRFTKKSIYEIHLSVVHNGNNPGTKIKPKLLVVSLAPLNSKKSKGSIFVALEGT